MLEKHLNQWTPTLAKRAGIDAITQYFELVVRENELQNLTRIISPEDFVEGHLIDVEQILCSGWTMSPLWADLGAGGGLPGIPLAMAQASEDRRHAWLVESEKRKALFLERALLELGLPNISAIGQRFEAWASRPSRGPEQIFSRAVGKIGKLLSWIEVCSTWNNLVLLKGPGWDAELEEFLETPDGRWYGQILEFDVIDYVLPISGKKRKLVRVRKIERN